jgi:fatty-acyl-CoA synthase
VSRPPPTVLADRLRARLDWVRAAGRQGAAVARVMGKAGVLGALRPRTVARFARRARGARLGPHLAVMLHAEARPTRAAVADAHRRLTYAELEREVNQLAHALGALGVQPGDRVAIMLPNCAEFLVVLQALPRLGATAVQIGTRLKAGEIEYILDNARPRAMIVHASLAVEAALAVSRAGTPAPGQLIEVGVNGAGQVHGSGVRVAPGGTGPHRYHALLSTQPTTAPIRGGGDAGGIITYTSGTTGKPKGARRNFSQTGLEAVADLIGQVGVHNRDRHLVVCPLYHSAAPAFALIMMSVGGSLIVCEHFDAEEVLATIEREAVTCAFMVPTQLVRLTALPREVRSRYDTSSLRWILSGAAPLATETARRFQEAFGPILWNFYGATETGLVSLAGPADHTARPGTVGRPLRGNQIRILGEDGEQVPTGQVGELYVRNSMLISGYHGDKGATDSAMREGFFSVGDLARVDEDGHLYLASRLHDMVISGGVNIYPAEIEEHLHLHPDVLEAAVIGVPDEEWGERLKAFVVTRQGAQVSAEDLVQFCREGLADFKRPREVQFLDALPRNPTGKVLKRELRAR